MLGALLVALLTLLLLPRCAASTQPNEDACLRGYYRQDLTGTCTPCPRGTYGSQTGLTTPACSGDCPIGTYSDVLAVITQDDCKPCPPGTFGLLSGLTVPTCSGSCPRGKYSLELGLASPGSCLPCGTLYFEHQNCLPLNAYRKANNKNSHYVFGQAVKNIGQNAQYI